MISWIKKMFRWLFRLVFKLVLLLCLIVILVFVTIFLFPEKIVEISAPYVSPGLICRAGSINWMANGIRLYDLHLSFRGSTANLERVSLTWQTLKEAPSGFLLSLSDGNFSLSLPDPVQTESPLHKKEDSPADWWNTFQSPVTVRILATNITFLANDSRLQHPLSGKAAFDCLFSGTTLLNRVTGSCSGLLPASEALMFSVLQHSNTFIFSCENAAIDLPQVADRFAQFFPDSVSCSHGRASLALRSHVIFSSNPPVLTNTHLAASFRGLDAAIPRFDLNAQQSSADLRLFSTQAVHLHTNHPDMVKYLFESFKGSSSLAIQSFSCTDIPVTNITVQARIISNAVYLVGSQLHAFGGRVRSTGRLARKKVKGKQAWRFRYDIDIAMTNLDAGSVCDTFNLYDNRLEGRFHGRITTYVYNRWVKKLSGTLDSDGNGTFYFPESEKYVKSMDAGMQKQMVTIMTERLKNYPYQICHIDLDYDRLAKTTSFTFGFYSDYDNSSYIFPVVIHMSWLDALKLLRQFQ